MVNIKNTPFCNTISVHIALKLKKIQIVVKIDETECVCVVECNLYVTC
jgi:hypothetical protein